MSSGSKRRTLPAAAAAAATGAVLVAVALIGTAAADADGPDQVKDIRSGEQVDADPDTWNPPAEDLVPAIVTHTPEELS